MAENDVLSRRERQIMDILYELSAGTVKEVSSRLPDAPSDSAMRTMLGRLVEKGQLKRSQRGPASVFAPATPRSRARRAALSRVVKTFFDGSVEQAVSALLSSPGKLDEAELDRLAEIIEAKRRGK